MLHSKILIISLWCLLFGQFMFAAQQQATPVRTAPVQMLDMQKRSTVTGTIRALNRSELSFQEPGLLSQVLVREGDAVKQGQKIAVLDKRRLILAQEHAALAVRLSEAEIKKHEATLQSARSELKRRNQASKATEGSISEEILEQAATKVSVAEADLQSAQHQLAQAKNDLSLAQIQLQDAELFAPFDGHVVTRQVDRGEWITPGQAVVTIVSSGKLEAVFDVPEQQTMEFVQKMETLPVLIDSSAQSISSESFRVVPDVDPRSRRYVLLADLPVTDNAIVPGMSVSCAVASSELASYKIIPSDAVMRDTGGAFVYKAAPMGDMGQVSMPVAVKVLFIEGKQMAVVSESLKEGDHIVVEGNERLRPMMPLQVLEGK